MRYHQEKPAIYLSLYGKTHTCGHPVYDRCTLYLIDNKGLAVIQQRYDAVTKHTWWGEIDPWLTDLIYTHDDFLKFFNLYARPGLHGIYPTVTVRQIMWALKLKPMKKERWETCFDRKSI